MVTQPIIHLNVVTSYSSYLFILFIGIHHIANNWNVLQVTRGKENCR